MAKRTKRKVRVGASEPRDRVSLAMPTAWDPGAAGPANRAGLEIEQVGEIDPETGAIINPNSVTRARRVDRLERMHRCYRQGCRVAGKPSCFWITTGQYNAAVAIREAFETTQRGPGVDYSRPRVDSSPKPDHAIAILIDAITGWHSVAARIPRADQRLIFQCVIQDDSVVDFKAHGGARPYASDPAAGMAALRAALDRYSA